MTAEKGQEDGVGLKFTQEGDGPRLWMPWVAAGCVVAIVVTVLAVFGGRSNPSAQNIGTGVAALDPYAANLVVGNLKMSEASNFAGGKVTYLDGEITNRGPKTLLGVSVQVVFRNSLNEIAQRETTPLSLIRTREPYVDTQPVKAAPIKAGERRDFRLIFDALPVDWNQQYPEIRIVNVIDR